ncbi:hypothetical protein M404DRAFT_212818 [Pisolithus tinctorius Marx 270]|uniref:Uncharacterized protein n=1 Tax=Pisolithus tinctorius Marx 270 TaxID=870435 RepID=A0A0C3JL17_PISTI|nr:hypothetical protein M404DRAFT_212818 [Pisolithus tinctorius Marx 270]
MDDQAADSLSVIRRSCLVGPSHVNAYASYHTPACHQHSPDQASVRFGALNTDDPAQVVGCPRSTSTTAAASWL